MKRAASLLPKVHLNYYNVKLQPSPRHTSLFVKTAVASLGILNSSTCRFERVVQHHRGTRKLFGLLYHNVVSRLLIKRAKVCSLRDV